MPFVAMVTCSCQVAIITILVCVALVGYHSVAIVTVLLCSNSYYVAMVTFCCYGLVFVSLSLHWNPSQCWESTIKVFELESPITILNMQWFYYIFIVFFFHCAYIVNQIISSTNVQVNNQSIYLVWICSHGITIKCYLVDYFSREIPIFGLPSTNRIY